jgi:hypothetical protein
MLGIPRNRSFRMGTHLFEGRMKFLEQKKKELK